MSEVKRFYPFAVAEGIIKWLPIDTDEAAEMEFVCLAKADYDAETARADRAVAEYNTLLARLEAAEKVVQAVTALDWELDEEDGPYFCMYEEVRAIHAALRAYDEAAR